MSKQVSDEKIQYKRIYKIILIFIWAAILIVCFRHREYFTVDGVLGHSPQNTVRGDFSEGRTSEQHQRRKWAGPSYGHDP